MNSIRYNEKKPEIKSPNSIGDVESLPLPVIVPKSEDVFLVAFNEPFDTENPMDWLDSRKWAVISVLSATGFNRIMVSTIMAPALSIIAAELEMNTVESAMALSIYLLATAFGPLVIGPLSEVYGRKNVLHASNVWFLVWNVICGFANTKELLIAARFLAGFGASSIYALAGGVLADIWRPEQRGKSLGIYLLVPLLGAAVGPIIGGFMTARTTWRWIFWATSIFQAIMIVVSFTVFRETYSPLILKHRAKRLRRENGDEQYYTAQEHSDKSNSVFEILIRALTRPLRLLAFHPIIQVASVIAAFYYGILYIVLSSFSDLWTNQYQQSVETSGLHYIACALGEVAGATIGGSILDYMFRRKMKQVPSCKHVPEFRIPLTFPGALIAPLGLFIYGWAAEYRVHWIAVDIGVFLITFGMQVADMPMQLYVIEAYPEHTSSALAALQFLRSITAFLFPLFAPDMYNALGYGWGNSTVAFAGLAIGLPAPLTMWKYGAKLRAKASSSY